MSAANPFIKSTLMVAIGLVLNSWSVAALAEEAAALEEVVVEGSSQPEPTTHYTSPSTLITEFEAEAINATTIEDFVKYEPSMVTRRRYIGDSNGVVGMRGSNMFQTARTMVFADGLPLHYLLETQYNGSPRWSLVAADETRAVEVVYGPFSAEYSGNAMGGVINVETKLPTEREFHAEAGTFTQSFQHLGADKSYTGNREFVSYGDRMGDLSLYLFHNHLENESQPMTFRYKSITAGAGTAVTGAYRDKDATGKDVIYYGDSGADEVTTDLTKLKLGYDFGRWEGRMTLAYEDRDKETNPTNYLRDAAGNPVWSGNVVYNGDRVSITTSHFAVSEQNRETLLVGAGLAGPLGESDWVMNIDASRFAVLDDQTLTSSRNPADPLYTSAGQVKEYEDTGWETLDLKVSNESLAGRDDMSLVVGYHFSHYSLQIHDYNSNNYVAAQKGARRTSSGGDTRTQALFAQWGWDFAPGWDVALGGRYESWRTENGYYHNYTGNNLQDFDSRTETGISPKFSLGFEPDSRWKLRYSLAKAYRFPIVEELFKNEYTTNGSTIADASLKPEVGIHHNFMVERQIPRGFVRANLYHEVVDDVIFNQTDVAASVTTYLPVDEVTTSGAELIVQQERVLGSDVDVRFNVAYTDAEVTENRADPTVVGKDFPRMPPWRVNLLATYHVNASWDTSLGFRFASNSFGQLDNSDTTSDVYGAQDSYRFVDVKANYWFNDAAKLSFGIDNLTDEVAFVAHPWSQRTVYLQGSIDF